MKKIAAGIASIAALIALTGTPVTSALASNTLKTNTASNTLK